MGCSVSYKVTRLELRVAVAAAARAARLVVERAPVGRAEHLVSGDDVPEGPPRLVLVSSVLVWVQPQREAAVRTAHLLGQRARLWPRAQAKGKATARVEGEG